MAQYVQKPHVFDAVQWFPDEEIAKRTGYDKHGVEYTVCDTGLRQGASWMNLTPGDWILTSVLGGKSVLPNDVFQKLYEPLHPMGTGSFPLQSAPAAPRRVE